MVICMMDFHVHFNDFELLKELVCRVLGNYLDSIMTNMLLKSW